jgi:hypothetical protein
MIGPSYDQSRYPISGDVILQPSVCKRIENIESFHQSSTDGDAYVCAKGPCDSTMQVTVLSVAR